MNIEDALRLELDAAHADRRRMERRLEAAFSVLARHGLLEELAEVEQKHERRLAVQRLETCRTRAIT